MKKVIMSLFTVMCIAVSVFVLTLIYPYISVRVKKQYITTEVAFNGRFQESFSDKNNVQLPTAMRIGVPAQKCEIDMDDLIADGKLVHLNSCCYYRSFAKQPYLTPEAADLLAEIGKRYKEKQGYWFKTITVTSMFRTEDYIKDLKKRNGNAVSNSCHRHGTTFDISYSRLTKEEKTALAQVLLELKSAGFCHVLYEVKQPCFHITVRDHD